MSSSSRIRTVARIYMATLLRAHLREALCVSPPIHLVRGPARLGGSASVSHAHSPLLQEIVASAFGEVAGETLMPEHLVIEYEDEEGERLLLSSRTSIHDVLLASRLIAHVRAPALSNGCASAACNSIVSL